MLKNLHDKQLKISQPVFEDATHVRPYIHSHVRPKNEVLSERLAATLREKLEIALASIADATRSLVHFTNTSRNIDHYS